jgi:hypothetical protein
MGIERDTETGVGDVGGADTTVGFDMDSAVDDIGAGLGYGEEDATNEGIELEVEKKPEETFAPMPESKPMPEPEPDKPAPPAPGDEPPRTWKPEVAALWAGLDPAVKAEVQRREQDIFKGIEQYKTAAQTGQAYQSVIDPYMPILKQFNIDPVTQVKGLMNAHYQLATGSPETKAALFQQLARDYNVDLSSLPEPSYVDPAVQALRAELNGVKSTLSAREAAELRTQQETLSRQIDTFASDKTAHPYFDEVANDIANLLTAKVSSTLEDAYERAVWANPVTRAKEQTRLSVAAEAKRVDEEKARAAKARQSLRANVRPTAKNGSATAPVGSMDDTIQETLARINARG